MKTNSDVLFMAYGLEKIKGTSNEILNQYGYDTQHPYFSTILFNGKTILAYENPDKPYFRILEDKKMTTDSSFLWTPTPFRLFLYKWYEKKQLFSSDQEAREILLDIRSKLEGSFEYVDYDYQDFLEKTAKKSKDIAKLKENYHDEILTIYRGQASKSTSYEEALSWTLDKNVALFFANRFDSDDSKILKSRVHINDVIAYISDREEFEVLVPCENLLDTPIVTKPHTNRTFL